jgi:hypothetical protein
VRFPTRQTRRLGLIALALGTAGLATAMASFALFSGATSPQTDTFASGTVSLDRRAPALDCIVADIEPGDSGRCRYRLRYSGTLAAWVGLHIRVRSSAAPARIPPGSVTPEGGEPLLVGGRAGLQVTISDGLGNPLGLPALTCAAANAKETAICQGVLADQVLLDGGTGTGPTGAWTAGARDTVTVDWALPPDTPDTFQGGRAVIELQADAVQAAGNPLVGRQPRAGWGGGTGSAPVRALRITPSTSAFGSAAAPVLVGGRSVSDTFTVVNGANPASGLDVRLGDGQAAQWHITADGCPQTLPAGGSCRVTVRFAPQNAGSVATTPITERATLEVIAGKGGGASAALVGSAAWGCTASKLGCALAFRGMVGADLQGQNLSGADMQDDDLNAANLRDANLSGANLVGAAMSVAHATGLNLDGANLTEAGLTGMTGTGIQTNGTIWTNTNCPDGTFSYQNPGDTCAGHFLP